MRFATALSLLLPFLSLVHAQDNSNTSSYVQDFVSTLQQAGFTELADALTKINDTTPAQTLFSELASGRNFTVFAPDNEAVQNISSTVSSNTSLLAEYISYHFINGNFENTSYTNSSSGGSSGNGCNSSSISSSTQTSSSSSASGASVSSRAALSKRLFGWANSGSGTDNSSSFPQIFSGVFPNVTLGRTLLNSSDLVMLEGNKSQVLAWTRGSENGNVTILNQPQNVTIINATTWSNLFINGINGVLVPPGNLTTALTATNATAAQALLTSVQVPSANGTNETVIEALQEAHGITIFIPNNDAFTCDVNKTIQDLQSNQTALAIILQNHYINGTTLYSTQIANESNVTTAAGESIQFLSNQTGLFLEGPNGTSAQVVRPDVLLNNGVVHIIDRFLVVEDSDPSAASSAYASATSEAAVSTTETSPIGIITSSSSSETSSSSSGTSSSGTSSSETTSSEATSSGTSSSETTSSETSSSLSESGGGGRATSTVTVTASAFVRHQRLAT